MDDKTFAARVRALAASDGQSFSALTALAGLNPRRDFRQADLSGVDLRGEDLRAFDFTNASFRGAQVLGARFNDTVKASQLQAAAATVRGLVVLVGQSLLTDLSRISDAVAPFFALPHPLMTAIRQVDADRERRQERSGAYIGDSSDLVRRRLSSPFRTYLKTLPARAPVLILFEPEGDFDFDTLNVVIDQVRRSKREPFVFMFPQWMEREAPGIAIVRARLAEFPASIRMNLAETPSFVRVIRQYPDRSASTSQLQRSKDRILGFLSALSWSLLMTFPRPGSAAFEFSDGEVWLQDGLRTGRESLVQAVDRVLEAYSGGYRAERRVVFMRSDAFERGDAEALAVRSQSRVRWDLASFPVRAGFDAHFYILSGPAESSIWEAVRLIGSKP